MPIKETQKTLSPSSLHSEEILVVQRKKLFKNVPAWHGIKADVFDTFIDTIHSSAIFMPRPHAETNPFYKQIIPYLIFRFQDKYFVMQRKKTASEQRLANKYSMGIGGHVRQEDIQNKNIFDWAKREFEEEVNYTGSLQFENLGVLNDDSSEVGKVHLGMVILVTGDSDNISIKDEHKSGQLLTLKECQNLFDTMETWSQISLKLLQELS